MSNAAHPDDGTESMFIGHLAVALAAKKAAPHAKLGTLVLAAQWLDLLWPIFLLAGLEQVRPAPGITRFSPFDFVSYPYTHSLAAVIGWAILLGAVYFLIRREIFAATVVALLVVSHWVLDWFTHRPDLPLYAGGPKVGLGLWNSVAGTLTVEILLFVVGSVIYLRSTRARDKTGTVALWSFLIFLLVMYFLASFSPTVPDQRQIAWGGLAIWVFIPWAYWIDGHREARS